MGTRHDAIEDVVGLGPSAVVHDQHLLLGDARLTAELGLTHHLAVGAMLPWRSAVLRIRYLDDTRRSVALAMANVHHRNETLTGPGDPWLWLRYTAGVGKLSLGVRAGVALPIGRVEPDPFRAGKLGLEHQHLQFGTGTFDPLLGLEAAWKHERWSLLGWATTVQTVYENRHGYQAGDRWALALSALAPLGTRAFTFHLGIEAQAETAERWRGAIPDEEGNRGRLDLLAFAGASWRFVRTVSAAVSLRLPVLVHVENAQLDYPLIAMVSISGAFDLGRAPAGDASQATNEAAPATPHDLDVAAVGVPGEAVTIAPVPGKVTVWDFWASWCVPCHELDRRLATLARLHPGAVAIRKVDVRDPGSVAWRKHVAGAGAIPHVKVFDADGRMVLERTAAPQELVRSIELLLQASPARRPVP